MGYSNFNVLDLFGYGSIGTVLSVFLVIGIILAIVLLVVFLPARNRGRYTGAAKWFYDFLNFNKFWISSIIKVIFIVLSTVCFAGGLIVLFISPAAGLGLLVYGIVIRLLLELTMLIMSIRDNVSQINDTLNDTFRSGRPVPPMPPQQPYQPQPQYTQPQQYAQPPQPQQYTQPLAPEPQPTSAEPAPVENSVKYCPSCGEANDASKLFCSQCGAQL